MQGTITLVNPRTGCFAVEVEAGDYTVIELTDTCEIEVGDIVSGNLHSPGGESLRNVTRNESMSVYVQGTHCAAETARAMVSR